MNEGTNPYAVTTLETAAPPAILDGAPSKIFIWSHLAAIVLLIVGAIVAQIDIESIVGSGPIMLIWGLVSVMFFRRRGAKYVIWFWLVCVAFPVIVFLLIWLLGLSPSGAQLPIGILIGLVTTGTVVGLSVSLMRYRRSFLLSETQGLL